MQNEIQCEDSKVADRVAAIADLISAYLEAHSPLAAAEIRHMGNDMAWFVIRDASGEVLELTHCSDEQSAQLERMNKAIKNWQQRGDHALQLGDLKFRMTSFDGNVRVLSIEPDGSHEMDAIPER